MTIGVTPRTRHAVVDITFLSQLFFLTPLFSVFGKSHDSEVVITRVSTGILWAAIAIAALATSSDTPLNS